MFKSKVFLAPMAGITDVAFRELCSLYGAGLTVTELISCKAILQGNEKTLKMIQKGEEKPFSIQLFGSNVDDFVAAAKIIEDKCDIIDINMGCPAPNVAKQGAGSGLLDYPAKCGEIVKRIKEVVSKPISIKIRLGVKTFTAVEVIKECEKAGVDFITIHGRYAYQGYSGKADWEKIKKLKEISKVLIVGNGDINSVQGVVSRLVVTDYISIGRGASGNPFIFKQINHFLKTGEIIEISLKERKEAFEKYLELCSKYEVPLLHQKIQAQHWIKGFEGSARAREKISLTESQEELKKIVRDILI